MFVANFGTDQMEVRVFPQEAQKHPICQKRKWLCNSLIDVIPFTN